MGIYKLVRWSLGEDSAKVEGEFVGREFCMDGKGKQGGREKI